jgi:uncharacterized protein (DUF433 family)
MTTLPTVLENPTDTATEPLLEAIPIRRDEFGVLRVGGTKVSLEAIVYDYRLGTSAETIVEHYPVLAIEDVYFAIGFYLRYKTAVDAYVQQQEVESAKIREEAERRFPPKITREMLLARLANRKSAT